MGLNKQQILGILGNPDTKLHSEIISSHVVMGIKNNTDKDEYITYSLGPRQVVYDGYGIRIYFGKDDRVEKYVIGQFVT